MSPDCCRAFAASIVITWWLAGAATPASAADGDFDLGLRGVVVTGNGEPTNDITGFGLFGHARLDARWSVGFALDHSPEFDVERAPDLVGLAPPEVVDAKGSSTTLSGWIERAYGREEGRWEWFWSAGVGVADVSVDDVAGALAGGGSFDLATDAGTEFVASVALGVKRRLGGRWILEAALRGDQHFADWSLTDRVSGATGTVDDYFVKGVHFGVARRF